MTNGPIEFQLAASFDWETLVPVLFFILYGVAQFLGSKKKGDAEEDETEEYDREDADMEERARRIREEIRRKIEERRQQQGKPAPQPVKPAAYDPTLPEQQQAPRSRPQPRTYQPAPAPRPVPVPQPVDTIPSLPAESSLERKLHEQRILLQKARKQKQEARDRAREIESAARKGRGKMKAASAATTPDGSLRQGLLTGLRDPMSVRKAVLYREILDPPIGLR